MARPLSSVYKQLYKLEDRIQTQKEKLEMLNNERETLLSYIREHEFEDERY